MKKKTPMSSFIGFRSVIVGQKLRDYVTQNPDGPSMSAIVRAAVEDKLTALIDAEIAKRRKP
jgi:hypothetical protein